MLKTALIVLAISAGLGTAFWMKSHRPAQAYPAAGAAMPIDEINAKARDKGMPDLVVPEAY